VLGSSGQVAIVLALTRELPCRLRVGTLNWCFYFAAQWLACRLPCQRFVSHLAMRHALLRASFVCYSFPVRNFHSLLFVDLPAH
jgi:hypothetical protein